MSIFLFLFILLILILVHEWGHFITAKKTGMRVDQFAIGFPPKLFGIKKGDTEYTFNILPIGGFVKIWGENYDEIDDLKKDKTTDHSRAFYARPKWAQSLVLVAGVFMNVVFAWFLFTATNLIGSPTVIPESEATSNSKLYIANTLPDSPAAKIPAGSIIMSVYGNGKKIDNPLPSQFISFVGEISPDPVTIKYLYNGKEEIITLQPKNGILENNPERYVIGASVMLSDLKSYPLGIAIADGFNQTVNGISAITKGLFGLLRDILHKQADLSQVAGPVGIVGMVDSASSQGLSFLLTFTAMISLNLAVINILPFPALDGGRLLFVLIEAVTRRTIPFKVVAGLNLVGFLLLMLLMVVITYNDILKLFT